MDIGKRLRELREARRLSQGDLEKRTGLLRCYTSRVENGHTIPSLDTLEKYAKALEVELYQLFYLGDEKPQAPRVGERPPLSLEEQALLKVFNRLAKPRRNLLLGLAREMAATERRKVARAKG